MGCPDIDVMAHNNDGPLVHKSLLQRKHPQYRYDVSLEWKMTRLKVYIHDWSEKSVFTKIGDLQIFDSSFQ